MLFWQWVLASSAGDPTHVLGSRPSAPASTPCAQAHRMRYIDSMAEREGRPSPDALLEAAKQEGRGRLKIFLGAAPGVGKTYEMLLSAQAIRREGVDVVVGIVEPHGRPETEALLEGLEVIPRLQVDYKGHLLAEMDIDAILKRRPKLVLV